MAIQRYAGDRFTGLSGDSKPLNVANGAIFYETNTAKEFILVSGSWVEMLGISGWSGFSGFSGIDGADGDSGYSGFSGIDGVDGDSGYSGFSGQDGVDGDSGYSGFSGIDGADGDSGYSGMSGQDGADGDSGYSGWSGLSGVNGADGDAYKTTSSTSLEIKLGATGVFVVDAGLAYSIVQDVVIAFDVNNWMYGQVTAYNPANGNMEVNVTEIGGSGTKTAWTINLDGAAGPQGDSGYSGISGFSGIDGTDGDSGYSGFSGQDGVDGDSGYSGFSGQDGIDGDSGYSGWSGISGFSGQDGVDGDSGYSGFSGIDGADGDSGISGWSGFSGMSGAGIQYWDRSGTNITPTNAGDQVDIGTGGMTQKAATAMDTPAADTMAMYVVASGTTPNRVIKYCIKDEAGNEIILTSIIV